MTELAWYQTHETLIEFASWLDESTGAFETPADVIYFFEKPWKYAEEYEQYRQHREQYVEALRNS